MSQYKTCSKCGQTKALDVFGKHKSSKGGIRASCKPCEADAYRTYRNANPQRVRDSKRDWARKNPDKMLVMWRQYQAKYKIRLSDYNKNYRQENLERLKLQAKKYYLENKDAVLARNKNYLILNPQVVRISSRNYRSNHPQRARNNSARWRDSNPELCREKSQRRRALRLNNGVFKVTAKELARLYASTCAYCKEPSKHIDHIIPLSRGGTHSIGNLTGACASCNLSKGAKFMTEWRKEQNGSDKRASHV